MRRSGVSALSDSGEPVYGPRDVVNLDKIAGLGLPFWLAGSYGSPERLREALAQGASGIQVGTAFALSKESGLDPDVRRWCAAPSTEPSASSPIPPRRRPDSPSRWFSI